MSDQQVRLEENIFSEERQMAIVGYMLNKPSFFNRCAAILKPSYFTDTDLSTIVKCAFEMYEDNKIPPKQQDVAGRINIKFPTSGSKYQTKLALCESNMRALTYCNLVKDMQDYLQACEFSILSNEVSKVFNSGAKRSYGQAIELMNEGIQEIRSITFNDAGFSVIPDPRTLIHNRQEAARNRLTIGNPKFDALLNGAYDIHGSEAVNSGVTNPLSEANKRTDKYPFGCLGQGNTTMILGPTNSGKTSTVVSIIVANLIANKKVLFLTHEQTEEEIQMKLAECLHFKSYAEMEKDAKDPSQKMAMDKMYVIQTEKFKNLFYRNWVDASKMYVEDVISFINNKQAEEVAATGSGFDLIIDDYPGKLSSRSAKKFSSEYAEQTYVYDQFVQLALQHNNHVILPLQVNRGGASLLKENASGKSEIYKYVTESDVAGAFNVMHRADNIITINSSPTDKKYGVIRYFIAKARSARTNKVFITKAELGKSTTHNWNLQGYVFDEIDPISNNYSELYKKVGVTYEERGSSQYNAPPTDVMIGLDKEV